MTFEFEVIAAALFSIIDMYCIYRLLNSKLTFRFSKEKIVSVYVTIYALYVLFQVLMGIFSSYPVKLPLMLTFYFLLFIIYSDAIHTRLFWILITLLILALCELVSCPFVMLITHTSFENISQTKSAYCVGMILSRILLFLAVSYFTRSKYAKRKMFNGFSKEICAIILIDGIYLIVFLSLFYYQSFFIDVDTAITLSLLVLILISALSIYLLQKVMRKSEEIMNTTLKLQQAEMEHKLTSDMTSVVENLRSLRHDMNNHMSILQGLLSVKAYDDMEDYLASLTKELSVANSFYFPENKVLSVLLNSKISKASQLGITFETEILTSETPFSERDLCAVIGNIIENAIEASSIHTNPYIYFTMYRNEQQLHIQCDNTYITKPVFENGRLITSKEDKTTHGIGTQNICSIVEAYHGTTKFSVDERFHVAISIPV